MDDTGYIFAPGTMIDPSLPPGYQDVIDAMDPTPYNAQFQTQRAPVYVPPFVPDNRTTLDFLPGAIAETTQERLKQLTPSSDTLLIVAGVLILFMLSK